MLIAIDPGNAKSALVEWDGRRVIGYRLDSNEQVLLRLLAHKAMGAAAHCVSPLVIEKIASYGMAVGEEVFETCVWTGRFMQAYGADHTHRIARIEVKNHICHSSRAKDANIRQALIDRLGVVGTKKSPGPLFGMKADLWAALAVAVTWYDLHGSTA